MTLLPLDRSDFHSDALIAPVVLLFPSFDESLATLFGCIRRPCCDGSFCWAFTRPRASTRSGVTTAGAGLLGNGIEGRLSSDLGLRRCFFGERYALSVSVVNADAGMDLTGMREPRVFSS